MGGTGCRIGEAAALTWADLDSAQSTIRFRGKTGERLVTLPPSLTAWLEARRGAPEEGLYGLTSQAAVHAFSRDLKALPWETLGIPRFTSHDIRRMVVDAYYAAGVDVGVVAQQLGQSPTVALQHYRQATGPQRARAVALAGLGRRAPTNVVALRRASLDEDET